MACGGCNKGGGNRHASTGGDLSQFAYLTPRQLRLLKLKQEQELKDKTPEDPNQGQG